MYIYIHIQTWKHIKKSLYQPKHPYLPYTLKHAYMYTHTHTPMHIHKHILYKHKRRHSRIFTHYTYTHSPCTLTYTYTHLYNNHIDINIPIHKQVNSIINLLSLHPYIYSLDILRLGAKTNNNE